MAVFLLILLPWVALAGQENTRAENPDAGCLGCHGQGSTKSRRLMDGDAFQDSAHGSELSCLACHPQAESPAHRENRAVTPVDCRDCHEIQGAHGVGAEAAETVRCHDCHSRHGILPGSDPASTLSRQQMARTCGACHAEAARFARPASLRSFRLKGHGKGDMADLYSRDRCLDCHQGQAAHMETQPLTEAACDRCHSAKSGMAAWLGSFHGRRNDSGSRAGDILYLSLIGVALLAFVGGWARRVRFWLQGGPELRWDRPGRRWTGFLRQVIGHRGLFRQASEARRHYLLFAGVALPLAVVVITQVRFRIPQWWAALFSLVLDLVGAALVVGVVLAALRYLRRPREDQPKKYTSLAGLVLVGLIAVSGFLVEGSRLTLTGSMAWTSPVGSLAALAVPENGTAAHLLWRFHLLLVLFFLALTPYCRMRHIVTAPLNMFFRDLNPRGRLRPVPLQEMDPGPQVNSLREMPQAYPERARITWKTRLDLDACLACRRCHDVCPAQRTDKPLSPMEVVDSLRTALIRGDRAHLDQAVTDEAVWDCTTCQACVAVCPVRVDPVDVIIGARRAMVLNAGHMPAEAAGLLRHLEVYEHPGTTDSLRRGDWARSMQSAVFPSEEQTPDFYLWLGCQGYAHPRAREVALALVRLVARAGQTARILGDDELCCGDPARRLGGEDVFQSLARKNIERLKRLQARRMLVFCPHCFNTLANEYPDYGADFEVIPALSWVADQVAGGVLKIVRPWPYRVAYHDPCYLSRINGVTEAPRSIMAAVPGLEMLVPRDNGGDTLCCGAGGGRMWLHESGMRINQMRAAQCRETGAQQVATACPYCLVMLADGLADNDLRTLDILEIVEWVTR